MRHSHDPDKDKNKDSDRRATAHKTAAPQTAAPQTAAPQGPGGILGLQRTAGNAAVARALQLRSADGSHAHQRSSSATAVVQRMDTPNSKVLSGHGRFGQNQLIPMNPGSRRDGLKPTFTVPEGIEIVMYAPPGASLENVPAQEIEQGRRPTRDQLELRIGSSQRKDLPEDYPRTFKPGEELVNYQVTPLEGRHLSEGAVTVAKRTTLQQEAQELADAHLKSGAEGPLTLHHACCGAGHSDRLVDEDLFEHKGWSVELRSSEAPEKRGPSEEPEEPRKRGRRRK